MSNSSRWRRLCEWVRHLQDTNGEVDLPSLMKKMEEIKLGGGMTVKELQELMDEHEKFILEQIRNIRKEKK